MMPNTGTDHQWLLSTRSSDKLMTVMMVQVWGLTGTSHSYPTAVPDLPLGGWVQGGKLAANQTVQILHGVDSLQKVSPASRKNRQGHSFYYFTNNSTILSSAISQRVCEVADRRKWGRWCRLVQNASSALLMFLRASLDGTKSVRFPLRSSEMWLNFWKQTSNTTLRANLKNTGGSLIRQRSVKSLMWREGGGGVN